MNNFPNISAALRQQMTKGQSQAAVMKQAIEMLAVNFEGEK